MMISANLIIHPYSSMLNCWQAIVHAKPIMWVMNPSESLKTRDNLKFFVGWVVSVAKLRKHGKWKMEYGLME